MCQPVDGPLTNPQVCCDVRPGKPLLAKAGYRGAVHDHAGTAKPLSFARAFRSPARTRSAIRLRSNSATAPRTVKTMRPAGVAVSSDSDRGGISRGGGASPRTVRNAFSDL